MNGSENKCAFLDFNSDNRTIFLKRHHKVQQAEKVEAVKKQEKRSPGQNGQKGRERTEETAYEEQAGKGG